MVFNNRITDLLGIEKPIVQAPMGWIARSPLASAVSNAGAMGIIETSSGELDAVRDEELRVVSQQQKERRPQRQLYEHPHVERAKCRRRRSRHRLG